MFDDHEPGCDIISVDDVLVHSHDRACRKLTPLYFRVITPTLFLSLLQADKLLSPEFEPIIEQLIGYLPDARQIMLYSATFPVTVKQFKVGQVWMGSD